MFRVRLIIAMAVSYFLFAILLNSVGTVILQSLNTFDVSKPTASTLEGFKDLSIAIASFLFASFIPKLGYKYALSIGLLLSAIACFSAYFLQSFGAIQVLFMVVGISFALVKISVYSLVGQLSNSTGAHSSLLNTIEGIFMLGVLSGYWVFAAFIDPQNPSSAAWTNVYVWLALTLLAGVLLIMTTPFSQATNIKSHSNNETAANKANSSMVSEFLGMLRLSYQPLVLIFIISIFLYVLIEQGVGTWLPTFNNKILKLPVDISIQITSIFAAMLAIGRLLAGFVLRKIDWYLFLNICFAAMALLILITLPLAKDLPPDTVKSIFDAPLAAFLLPLIGLFMAPIYPIINSVMLSSLHKDKQASMTGLIVVFSALGGTTGSVITGLVFEGFGGTQAFYLLLVPIMLVASSLYLFKRSTARLAA